MPRREKAERASGGHLWILVLCRPHLLTNRGPLLLVEGEALRAPEAKSPVQAGERPRSPTQCDVKWPHHISANQGTA